MFCSAPLTANISVHYKTHYWFQILKKREEKFLNCLTTILINVIFLISSSFFLDAQTQLLSQRLSRRWGALCVWVIQYTSVCYAFALWPDKSLISLIIRYTELCTIHRAPPRPTFSFLSYCLLSLPSSSFLLFLLVYFLSFPSSSSCLSSVCSSSTLFLYTFLAVFLFLCVCPPISPSVCLSFALPADFCLW